MADLRGRLNRPMFHVNQFRRAYASRVSRESLADAEAGKQPVQHPLRVQPPDQPLQRLRRDAAGSRPPAPASSNCRGSGIQRLDRRSRSARRSRSRLSKAGSPLGQRLPNRVDALQQRGKTLRPSAPRRQGRHRPRLAEIDSWCRRGCARAVALRRLASGNIWRGEPQHDIGLLDGQARPAHAFGLGLAVGLAQARPDRAG